MYRLQALLALVLMLAAGCPWPDPDKHEFTSADLRSYDRLGNPVDVAPGGGEADENADEPREVVEPDVIRRDGNTLYVLNQFRGLTIVDLESKAVRTQLPTYGFPRDLYIDNGRAYVLVGCANNYSLGGDAVSFSVSAKLYVIDVSDAGHEQIVSSFDFTGDLVDSRLVGNVLYAVCAQYEWNWAEAGLEKTQTSESWVTSVNVADPANVVEADEISFGGAGNVVHVSQNAIYVAHHEWTWQSRGDWTTITYVDISNPQGVMAVRGQVDVRGNVADRFKMDEWNGVLRVVSSAWEDERQVYVTTVGLDDPDNLEVLAETRLARAAGDTLFATRFDGDRAYIVTYFVKDPLFVVDLADPANPVVSGELEVPGWSTHIEPQGDRLVAIGVDDTDGRRVCVSLFDVTDPAAPGLVDRVSFGDGWSWSTAYDDVKAFTVLDDMLIVPFSGWTSDFGGYDRLQFVSYSPEGLEPRGHVDLEGQVLRSFKHGNEYCGVTTEQLAFIDASNPDSPRVDSRLVLAEDIADFAELPNGTGAEIVQRNDTGETTLRTVSAGGVKGLGEITVQIGMLSNSFVHGQSVVLVGIDWRETARYQVAIINCADPTSPKLTEKLDIGVTPYVWYGPWRYYGHGPFPEVDAAGKLAWWPGCCPAPAGEGAFLLGDILALRCETADYDTVLGPDEPEHGLALVDLTLPAWTSTLGLGYKNTMSLNAAGDKLYIGTRANAGTDESTDLGLCAYYLTELTVAEPSAGPTANVPGVFVQYESGKDLLTLRDDQWTAAKTCESSLRTVRWDGSDHVEEIGATAIPASSGRIVGRGRRVFVESYEKGYKLYSASVSESGGIALGEGVLVTKQWGALVDANGANAYVTIGNGAIARYEFGIQGRLADLVEVMGAPLRIRFGSATAYAPLGYFGLVRLP